MVDKFLVPAKNEMKDFTDTLNEKLMVVHEKEAKDELEILRSKVAELENINKDLQGKLCDTSDSNTTAPDVRILELESKFRQLESQKDDLENRLSIVNKDQTDQIDKLSENIRKITMQGAELECQVRNLRTKVPQLEDLNRKQDTVIESIKYKYNDATFDKIKDLERNVATLEDNNKRLEEQVEQMRLKQNDMNEEAERKIKETYEQKMEIESKVSKLKGKIKELEWVNNDLQSRLEEMKQKATEAAEEEKERAAKMAADAEALTEKINILQEEKTVMEVENQTFKKEIKKLKVKLVTYEKDL